MVVPEYDVVGDDATLLVCGAGQRYEGWFAGDQVHHLHGIAQGIDIRIGCLHVLVYDDPLAFADGEAGLLCEPDLGPHADAEQDHVGGDLPTATQMYDHLVVLLLESYHTVFEVESYALVGQMAVNDCGHREIQRGHHLVCHLDHVDMQAALMQVFGHFESDEPAAHDNGA